MAASASSPGFPGDLLFCVRAGTWGTDPNPVPGFKGFTD